jgi:hypothetical protein
LVSLNIIKFTVRISHLLVYLVQFPGLVDSVHLPETTCQAKSHSSSLLKPEIIANL